MDGFVHIRKAHCMFGWDWGAHLPDAGIWRPVTLLGVDTARIDSVQILQTHREGKVTLQVIPEIDYLCEDEAKAALTWDVTIVDPQGQCIFRGKAPETVTIAHPQLWWPHGYGDQNLYTAEVALLSPDGRVLDTWTRRIGLRTITMDRTPDQWGERFATCVNGVNIFAMCADYIPEDHLLGRVTRETTERLLRKAVFANFNAIRVWGGGYYPDDWFYDLCDEYGIVVWQDFMFASRSTT